MSSGSFTASAAGVGALYWVVCHVGVCSPASHFTRAPLASLETKTHTQLRCVIVWIMFGSVITINEMIC